MSSCLQQQQAAHEVAKKYVTKKKLKMKIKKERKIYIFYTLGIPESLHHDSMVEVTAQMSDKFCKNPLSRV